MTVDRLSGHKTIDGHIWNMHDENSNQPFFVVEPEVSVLWLLCRSDHRQASVATVIDELGKASAKVSVSPSIMK